MGEIGWQLGFEAGIVGEAGAVFFVVFAVDVIDDVMVPQGELDNIRRGGEMAGGLELIEAGLDMVEVMIIALGLGVGAG